MVAKSSKKGWKGIKLTQEMDLLADQTVSKELANKVETLFHEDTVGGMQGVSKALRKEVSLLNKSSKAAVALSELPLLEKSMRKVGSIPKSRRPTAKTGLCDIWADEGTSKVVSKGNLRRESVAPAVVPACSAMSVNPVKEDFEALLVQEAEAEMLRIKRRSARPAYNVSIPSVEVDNNNTVEATGETKVVPRKTKAQKLKEAKHKQMLKEHEQRRQLKAARRKGQDKAALEAELALQAARREARLKTRVDRIIAEAAGKTNGLVRGAGGRLLETPTILGSTEIAGSLRRIVPSADAVLERRASLLKRRMIEQVPEINAEYKEKVKFAKLDSMKAVKMMDKTARARCVLLG